EALVCKQFRLAYIPGEALPLMVQDRENDPSLAGLEEPARCGSGAMTSGRSRVVVAEGEKILHKKYIMDVEDTFVERDVDILADPGPFPIVKRGQNRCDAVYTAATVGEVYSRINGHPLFSSGQMQQARERLSGHIVSRSIRARTGLAEA